MKRYTSNKIDISLVYFMYIQNTARHLCNKEIFLCHFCRWIYTLFWEIFYIRLYYFPRWRAGSQKSGTDREVVVIDGGWLAAHTYIHQLLPPTHTLSWILLTSAPHSLKSTQNLKCNNAISGETRFAFDFLTKVLGIK